MSEREGLRAWARRLEELIGGFGGGTTIGPVSSTVRHPVRWASTDGTTTDEAADVEVTNAGSIVFGGGAEALVDGVDIPAKSSAHASHIADVANPHAVTASQVGLGSVANAAQLTRAANDWNGFSSKTPVSADVFLIEDSAAGGAKKKTTAGGITGVGTQNLVQTYAAPVTADQATSSATFVDLPQATITLTAALNDYLLIKFGCSVHSDTASGYLQIMVDGVATSGGSRPNNDSGGACNYASVQLAARVGPLSAGSHTVKIQFRTTNASVAFRLTPLGFGGLFPGYGCLVVKRVRA